MNNWKHLRQSLMTVLVFGLAPPLTAAPWTELADQLTRPQVAGLVELTGPLEVGRAKLTPSEGAVVHGLTADGVRCGLWIDGPATLTYTVDDRFSLPVARRNLNKTLSYNSGKDAPLVFRRELTDVVLWSWSFADLPGTDGGNDKRLPKWLGEVLDNPFFNGPAINLVGARHDNPRMVFGLLRSAKEVFVFWHDPLVERLEVLFLAERFELRQDDDHLRYYRHRLASQPIGRQWWELAIPPVVTTHTDLAVVNPADERVEIDATLELTAQRPTRVWKAELTNGWDKDGKRRSFEVESVEVDGKPAAYLHRENLLVVDLLTPLEPGRTRQVRVRAAGDLAIRYAGDNFWSLGIGWYPVAGLSGELSTTEITVRTPQPLLPFASGSVVERGEQDGFNLLHSKLDRPTRFSVVAAGKYSMFEESKDGRTCRIASYGIAKPKASRKLTQLFFHNVEFYESIFGVPYPFPDLTVIERNEYGFGQAPPGIIFITKEAFEPLLTDFGQLFSGGINERFAHEVAHAWWGHVVKWPSFEEQWLSESFAEYSAALSIEALNGGGKRGKAEFNKLLNGWKAGSDQIGKGASIYLANHLAFEADADDWTRRYLLYSRGPLVLHALRQELGRQRGSAKEGDKYFVALLRSMLKNFAAGWGETRHVVGILGQMTGTDWQPWFERYVYGTEVPDVK